MNNNELIIDKETLRLLSDLIIGLKLQIIQLEDQVRKLRIKMLEVKNGI